MSRKQYSDDFAITRKQAIERDSTACVKCGYTRCLEVHHIYGYKDSRLESLRTLCYLCHLVAPMGEEYFTWELSGSDGAHQALEKLNEKISIPFSEMYSIGVIYAICDFTWREGRIDLRGARQRMKDDTGRCEGRKAFGMKPGERSTLDRMRYLQRTGLNFVEIAASLNTDKTFTRYDKPWRASTVQKILSRPLNEPNSL